MNSFLMTLQFFVVLMAKLIVLFLGVSTLVGLTLQYVSEETLRRRLSRKGLSRNFLGAALGAVTPFCSCSTIPMALGLLRAKVPFGAVMSFVLASPLLNPLVLAIFLVLLGWKASAVYGAVTFLMAMACGSVLQALGFAGDVKKVRISGLPEASAQETAFGGKMLRALAGAWKDFRGVLVYLVIGVAIGAAVYGYLPGDFVVRIAGPDNPLAVPVAAVVGVPLYVRASTILPIAIALTEKGMSLGAVIALVVGGAGMSIPEMSLLAGIFKARLVAVFVVVVFSTAVIAGLIFNLIQQGV